MKKLSKKFLILIFLALILPVVSFADERNVMSENKNPTEVFYGMRDMVLNLTPDEIKVEPTDKFPNLYGLVMETGYPEATVTLITLIDGTVSLYFESGGGYIGMGGVKEISDAADDFLIVGERFVDKMKKTEEYPLPDVGRVKFYALTYDGKYTMEVSEEELGEKKHEFSPLFLYAHEVITQLREYEEKRKGDSPQLGTVE